MKYFQEIVGSNSLVQNVDEYGPEKWSHLVNCSKKIFLDEIENVSSEVQQKLGILTLGRSETNEKNFEKSSYEKRYGSIIYPLFKVSYFPKPAYCFSKKCNKLKWVLEHGVSLGFLLSYEKVEKETKHFKSNSILTISVRISGDRELHRFTKLYKKNQRLFEIILKSSVSHDYLLKPNIELDKESKSIIRNVEKLADDHTKFESFSFSKKYGSPFLKNDLSAFIILAALYDALYHVVQHKDFDRLLDHYHVIKEYL